MATQRAIAIRIESAINRLTDALGRDVAVRHKDSDVQTAMQLEALAEAVEAQNAAHAEALAEAVEAVDLPALLAQATEDELAQLPGIGETTARRIRAAVEKGEAVEKGANV